MTAWSSLLTNCMDTATVNVYRVELVPETTNVCWKMTTPVRLTLTNSWWGAGGIEWSGTNGLRVTEVANDHLTFTPTNSLPTNYTVRATARDFTNCWDESTVNVLKIDIEQVVTNVCWKMTNAVLSLTSDSYWDGGSVTWTSTPAGLSGFGYNNPNCWFNPSNSIPTSYVVRAWSELLTNCMDTATANVYRVELVPETTNVCWKMTNAVRLTLTNSWWGAGGIEWSGTNGLRVIEVANDHLTFTPTNSLPTNYAVRATARDFTNCWDTSTVRVWRLEIVPTNAVVCGYTNAFMFRLTNSYWEGSSVVWTSAPAGLSPASGEGATFTVNPSTSLVTNYTITAYIKDLTNCTATARLTILKLDSLEARLLSTWNAVSHARPAEGVFVTTNRDLAFVPSSSNDLMAVVRGAGSFQVTANGCPPAATNLIRWTLERNPADTVAAGTPNLSTTSGTTVRVDPNVAGSFRLIVYLDNNGNGGFDLGEQCMVLRMASVQFNMQAGHFIRTAVTFNPGVNGVGTTDAMETQADFLLEGGGADRRMGVDRLVLGNVGNLLNDTFVVSYPVPAPAPPPPGNVAGTETEDPDWKVNPNAGFPSPMVDTVNVAHPNQPTGGDTPFRGNSTETVQGNGPGGNGQIRRVHSIDAPAFGWHGRHPTTGNFWDTTAGANAFREFLVVYSLVFPRTYSALASGDWTVNAVGNRAAGGTWNDTGSSVAIPHGALTDLVTAGSPQTGDASGVQVLGVSFVREYGMIVNP